MIERLAVYAIAVLCAVCVLIIAALMARHHRNQISSDSYQAHFDGLENSDSKKETNDV